MLARQSYTCARLARQTATVLWVLVLAAAGAHAGRGDGKFQVLTIGDSITRGEVYPPCKVEHGGNDQKNNRYLRAIQRKLDELYPALAKRKAISVVADALGGAGAYAPFDPNSKFEMMRTTLVAHTKKVFAEAKKTKTRYDWVVVMAGINDFLRSQPATKVVGALEQIWRQALAADADVLAVVPLASSWLTPSQRAQREQLAVLMQQRVAAIRKSCLPGAACVYFANPSDRKQNGPFVGMANSRMLQKTYLCDGLHLSQGGYDTLGDWVARSIRHNTDNFSTRN